MFAGRLQTGTIRRDRGSGGRPSTFWAGAGGGWQRARGGNGGKHSADFTLLSAARELEMYGSRAATAADFVAAIVVKDDLWI